MRTYITVLREGRTKVSFDVFNIEDLTDMRRYAKAMERARKSGKRFEIMNVSNRRD